jgi:hypothetical protein
VNPHGHEKNDDDVKVLWAKEFSETERSKSSSQPQGQPSQEQQHEKRVVVEHVLGGSILSVWHKLKAAIEQVSSNGGGGGSGGANMTAAEGTGPKKKGGGKKSSRKQQQQEQQQKLKQLQQRHRLRLVRVVETQDELLSAAASANATADPRALENDACDGNEDVAVAAAATAAAATATAETVDMHSKGEAASESSPSKQAQQQSSGSGGGGGGFIGVCLPQGVDAGRVIEELQHLLLLSDDQADPNTTASPDSA